MRNHNRGSVSNQTRHQAVTGGSTVLLPSKIARARVAKRRAKARIDVDSWPFLGVFITLLIIFMLYPGNSSHQHFYPDLPLAAYAASQPKAIRNDAMRVMITRDGSIFFKNAKVAIEDLSGLIRQAVKEGAERKIYMAVDARAKYGDAAPVLDGIREAEIRDVSILTDKREGH